MNSRNQTTIATGWKHRQLVFLHHTVRSARTPRLPGSPRPCLPDSGPSLYTTRFPFISIVRRVVGFNALETDKTVVVPKRGYMGRFASRFLFLANAIFFLWGLTACGGGTKPGPPLFAGHITVAPSLNTSVTLGGSIVFTASVQTASGITLNTPVTYSSSDTSVLNLSLDGVACAGHWDAAFTSCTPGNVGVAQVVASALGTSSIPVYVFVHPPIDNITVTGVLLNGLPLQEPCLSQGQSMTIEAHAFSHGTEITSSVGPITWITSNATVATVVGLTNTAYNFPTNQATATAVFPGITQIYATASGVTSSAFQQPQYTNSLGTASPVLDFFSTCPIQNIALEVGAAGSGQTNYSVSGGTTETIVATLTDVMGNTTLSNTNGGIVLSKIPLTWSSSQPTAISASSCSNESCSPAGSAGAAAVTASCSPPACNIGYPFVPTSLSTPAKIDACTQFFQPNIVNNPSFSCQELIPTPVYSSPVWLTPQGSIPLSPTGAISGVVSGSANTAAVLASSTGCQHLPPASCSTSAYYLSTARASAGPENPLPAAPNSLMFDPTGAKVFMGSDFGAQIINPSNFGTANSPYTSLGTVTGRVLTTSANGAFAVFSDTIHTPNQVYIVNTQTASPTNTPLNIPNATAAGFSLDGLKTFIVGGTTGNSLYVYSSVQALQGPFPLSGSGNAVAFAPNGAFAFIAESGTTPNLTAYATCNNQLATTITLPANPILMKVLPNVHLDGKDSYGNSIPDGIHVLVLDATGFDIITSTLSPPAAGTLCPQGLTFISGDPLRPVQRIELGQGTLQPVNFFASGDGSQLYVVNATSSTIFVYNFLVGSVIGGIPLTNDVAPLSADMSVDGGTIAITGSDGLLHEVSTQLGGADLVQLPFPNLPNYLNPFCSMTPASGPCTLNYALIRP